MKIFGTVLVALIIWTSVRASSTLDNLATKDLLILYRDVNVAKHWCGYLGWDGISALHRSVATALRKRAVSKSVIAAAEQKADSIVSTGNPKLRYCERVNRYIGSKNEPFIGVD